MDQIWLWNVERLWVTCYMYMCACAHKHEQERDLWAAIHVFASQTRIIIDGEFLGPSN